MGKEIACGLYSVAWVAALAVERAAAEAMLDERHDEPPDFRQHPSDCNKYTWGRVGVHNIVVAALPSGIYGTTAAAVTVSQMLASLPHIKIGLLVGIAGAIPRFTVAKDANGGHVERVGSVDIRLGDVVVGRPDDTSGGVVQYDLGKAKQGQVWEQKGMLNAPPPVLLTALAELEAAHYRGEFKTPELLREMWEAHPHMATAHPPRKPSFKHQGFDKDRLFRSDLPHPEGRTDCRTCAPAQQVVRPRRKTADPHIHYGLIASGNTLNCLCYEMEAAGIVSHFPCLIIRGICDYADAHKNDIWQPYASATAATYAKELLLHLPARELEITIPVRETAFFRESLAQIQAKIDHLSERSLLAQLPTSAGARYDSYAEGNNPLCLPDTRVEVFRDIFDWIDGNGARVFWLNGMAGTGKSTISRTLAKTLQVRGQLGGSFFFKRSEEDCNTIRKLSSTMAVDLAKHPAAKACILETLTADLTITTKTAQEQFRRLVLKPLSCMQQMGCIVIVMDALDECDDRDLNSFFSLVSDFRKAGLPKVKLFLTSRPDLPILRGFGNTRGVTHEGIVLHNVEQPIIEHDILVFLEHELGRIRDMYNEHAFTALEQDWPGTENKQKLVKMANRLFIFAATACRLIEQDTGAGPDEVLRYILTYEKGTAYTAAFAPTYLPVLNRQLPPTMPKSQRKTLICQLTLILGAMAAATDLLSVPALARLTDLDVSVVGNRLSSLGSVLEILYLDDAGDKEATQVRFLHLSFRNFLVSADTRDISPVWIEEQEAHRAMASNCLRVLTGPDGLRFNFCRLGIPGTPRSTVPAQHIKKSLQTEVRYACVWITHHIKKGKEPITDHGAFHQFLLRHFLHWLEASSFLGHAFQAIRHVHLLQELMNPQSCAEIKLFLSDAVRFVAANVEIMNTAPLQVYSSALIFSPEESIIRRRFEDRYNTWITKTPVVDVHWGIEFQNIQAHKDHVEKIIFSPDESLIAVLSYEKVRIISIMGEKLFAFRSTVERTAANISRVTVAFSSNSRFVVMGDETKYVQVWDVREANCVRLLATHHKGERSWSYPIAFIENDDCLAMTSRAGAEIWSLRDGEVVRDIQYPSVAYSTAISAELGIMVVLFQGHIIMWDLEKDQQIHRFDCAPKWTDLINWSTIDGPAFRNFDTVLLPNLDIWTVVHAKGKTHLMCPISGKTLFSVEEERFQAYTLTKQHLIVVASDNVFVWDSQSRELVHTSPTVRGVDTIAYSFKMSLMVVSEVSDPESVGFVFFWDLKVGGSGAGPPRDESRGEVARRSRHKTQHVASASDGTVLAYEDGRYTYMLRAKKGTEPIRAIPEVKYYTAMSARGRYLAMAQLRKGRASIWDFKPGEKAVVTDFRYEFAKDEFILFIFLSPDSKVVGKAARCRGNCSIQLFSAETGQVLANLLLPGQLDFQSSACLSSDKKLLAVAEYNEARIWGIEGYAAAAEEIFVTNEASRSRCLERREFPPLPIGRQRLVDICPGSTLLLYGTREALEIWHIRAGTCLQRISRAAISRASFHLTQKMSIVTSRGLLSFEIERRRLTRTYTVDHDAEQAMAVAALAGPAADSNVTTARIARSEISEVSLTAIYKWEEWGLSQDESWITWQGQNWLWLPLGYRPGEIAIEDNNVLIVNKVKGEKWYEFSENPKLYVEKV